MGFWGFCFFPPFFNFHLFFSKFTSTEIKHNIMLALGVLEIKHHERYLGLPSFVGKGKKATFSYIKERIGESFKDGRVNYYLKLVGRCYLN